MPRWTWCLPLAASLAAPLAASAAEPLDQQSIWTFQVENDAVSTQTGTSDQYYTSGLRLGWTSGQDAVDPIAAWGHSIWGDGTTRLSIDLSQSIFTPKQTQLNPPDPRDRPYAGELILTGGLVHDTSWTRDVVSVSLGVIGPAALARQVQNGFHNIIGDTPNRGWHYQEGDQPAFQFLGQRTWRLPIADLGFMDADVLPSLTASVGDIRDYVQLGGVLRFGQGLASDFGTARIEPGLNGADAYTAAQPFAWYGFAGVDGQAVGYDVTIDGSTFRNDSPSVSRVWDVGELEAGVAVMAYGLRITYTQTWQTQEFRHQKSGLFNFGSLAISAKF
jgi:lipid A 3-O-deacylase